MDERLYEICDFAIRNRWKKLIKYITNIRCSCCCNLINLKVTARIALRINEPLTNRKKQIMIIMQDFVLCRESYLGKVAFTTDLLNVSLTQTNDELINAVGSTFWNHLYRTACLDDKEVINCKIEVWLLKKHIDDTDNNLQILNNTANLTRLKRCKEEPDEEELLCVDIFKRSRNEMIAII